jgi:aminomethyltransferase
MTDPLSTPLKSRHEALGGKLVPFAGWWMPLQYAGIKVEHEAVRTRVGLFDVSHMGELRLKGPRATEVADSLVVSDLTKVTPGRARYTCACNEQGGIHDDLIVYRQSDQELLVVCNASNHGKILGLLQEAAAGKCDLVDETPSTGLLALQGPGFASVLMRAGCTLDVLASLPRFAWADATVGGVRIKLARTGYTGEDGVELFVPWQDTARLWDALLEAGTPQGLVPVGLGARDTLRLEACLPLYGNELDESTNPLEAGIGWTVHLQAASFRGREALLAAKEKGLARRLVGLTMKGRSAPRHGYPLISAQGEVIGVCTSGAPSPTLGKAIGLGYVPTALAAPGTALAVDCRGRTEAAEVTPTPFYRRPS